MSDHRTSATCPTTDQTGPMRSLFIGPLRTRALLVAIGVLIVGAFLFSTTRHAAGPITDAATTAQETAGDDISVLINNEGKSANSNAAEFPSSSTPADTAPQPAPQSADAEDLSAQLVVIYSTYLIAEFCSGQEHSFEAADLDHLKASAQNIESQLHNADAAQHAYDMARQFVQPYVDQTSTVPSRLQAAYCLMIFQAALPSLGRQGVQLDNSRPF